MSMKLYEINAAIDLVLQLAISGDMSDEDLRDNLEAIEMAFDEKAVAIACYVKNLLAEAEAIKAEEERLAIRRKKIESTAKRIEVNLSTQMQHAALLRISSPCCDISHIPSEKAIIDDLSMLPEAFVRRKPAPAPEADKTAIKAAFKAGTTVPGAHIEKFQNIQIK